MRRAVLTALMVAAATVLACSGNNENDPIEQGKYDQTWTKHYGETVCAEWQTEMDPHQRWVASADMLVGLRRHDGDSSLPSDAIITEFQSGVTTACSLPEAQTMTVAEAGAALYLVEKDTFGP